MHITNNEPDKNLWEDVRKGSDAAFEKLYLQYVRLLYRYGLKFTSQGQLIEDCIQELFSGIIKYHKTLSHTDNIKYYLLRSFKNKLIRILKKEQKYSVDEDNNYYFEVQFSIEHEIMQTEEERNRKKLLANAVKKLSSRQKEAIYLRYTNQLEYEEISSIMGMEVESCRNIIYKAIKTLRERIKETT
ncbi:hypothetical protein MNBD_BACTEROID01-1534 [hydrothermal vent metagenome]|uniref:RNA polymerase ECF-type sigma factor n=1 Tax=hydrothermal vent metagenome TaxID=652676 RepID=A0A3B0U437_9ZZZZ